MGYYTHFTLTWEPYTGAQPEVPQCEHTIPEDAKFCPECGKQVRAMPMDKRIEEWIERRKDNFYGVWPLPNGDYEPATWHDHESNMRALSKKFPFYLFLLSGEGEKNGDMWREFYLDGQRQRIEAKITYEDFNPEKLK